MTIPEIMEALTPYPGKFPLKAIREAVAQREAVKPYLLRALEEVASAPAEFAARKDYMLHEFASYSLAQFREKRACSLLLRILSAPGKVSDDLSGERLAEGISRILGSVYEDDPEPLKRFVEVEEPRRVPLPRA